jgi:hypothetical protein
MLDEFKLLDEVRNHLKIKVPASFILDGSTDESSRLRVKDGGYEIMINMNQCRTTRDFVFIAAHELAHLKQYLNNKGILKDYDSSSAKNYRLSKREWEADNEAIETTRSMKYENRIMNPDVPSLFLEVMTLRGEYGIVDD